MVGTRVGSIFGENVGENDGENVGENVGEINDQIPPPPYTFRWSRILSYLSPVDPVCIWLVVVVLRRRRTPSIVAAVASPCRRPSRQLLRDDATGHRAPPAAARGGSNAVVDSPSPSPSPSPSRPSSFPLSTPDIDRRRLHRLLLLLLHDFMGEFLREGVGGIGIGIDDDDGCGGGGPLPGLGIIPGGVVRFDEDRGRRSVPHIGWNGIVPRMESPVMRHVVVGSSSGVRQRTRDGSTLARCRGGTSSRRNSIRRRRPGGDQGGSVRRAQEGGEVDDDTGGGGGDGDASTTTSTTTTGGGGGGGGVRNLSRCNSRRGTTTRGPTRSHS
ncbi:hypothetical protein ACHAW5_004126 [Stephanodiscus triporus]|uniref:Uncharacterized protein n=1 Tax=Stephanodiscus triporus TaxID=2934178 RepID=A0ABD3QGG8_9STRA